MPTIESQFFFDSAVDDQAFSGEANIRKLSEAAPAANTTTKLTWSATGVQTRTVLPLQNTTTNSDTTINNGWAFNNGGADGLVSTANTKRLIPAGTWTFRQNVTINSPALLATISATSIAKVYRVANGGGARTLLFTTGASNNLSATGTATINFSAPEVVLEAGEVLLVGFTWSSQATSALFGSVTATVVTVNLGTGSDVVVPTGVRTLYGGPYGSLTDVAPASDILSRLLFLPRERVETIATTDVAERVLKLERATSESIPTTDPVPARKFVGGRALLETLATSDILARFFKGFRSPVTESAVTTDSPVQRIIKTGRGISETIPTTSAIDRVYHSFRSVSESIPIGADILARFFNGRRDPAVESIPTTETLALAFKGDRSITESALTVDVVERGFIGARLVTPEDIPIGADALARFFKGFRNNPETIPTVDAVERTGKYGRPLDPEAVQGVDFDLARKFVGGRALSETVPTTEALERLIRLFRDLSGTVQGTDIDLARSIKVFRELAENVPTVEVLTRLIKQRRFLAEFPTGVTPDYNVEFPTRKIAGIVRDQTGDPYEGAVVKLYRGQDDKMVQETVSAADGSYEFLRDLYDIYTYYVTAYEETGDPTEGLTIRGLVPENV